MEGYFFDAHVTGLEPDGNPIYDRAYQAADHADFYRPFFTNGIFANSDPDAFSVTVSGDAIKVLHVAPGRILVNGYQGVTNGTDEFVTISLANGYYRVIIRLDKSEDVRGFDCKLIYGSETEYPALVREGNIYDMCIANVKIESGVPIVEDTRADRDLCGYGAFTGQPPYQPPSDIPAIAWEYAIFYSTLTPEQRAIVEESPDLFALAGSARIMPRGVKTTGTASALLADAGAISLTTGAVVAIILHTAIAGTVTLNVSGTGAYPLRGTFARQSVKAAADSGFLCVFNGSAWVSAGLEMGPISGQIVITSSQTVNLANYDLVVGNPISVVCIGGGGGGGGGGTIGSMGYGGNGGAGGATSVSGGLSISAAGGAGGQASNGYSRGGDGGRAGGVNTQSGLILTSTTLTCVVGSRGSGGPGSGAYGVAGNGGQGGYGGIGGAGANAVPDYSFAAGGGGGGGGGGGNGAGGGGGGGAYESYAGGNGGGGGDGGYIFGGSSGAANVGGAGGKGQYGSSSTSSSPGSGYGGAGGAGGAVSGTTGYSGNSGSPGTGPYGTGGLIIISWNIS